MADLHRRIKVPDNRWVNAHRAHLSFKKSNGYGKWKHAQFLKQGGTCYYCDEPLNGARINDKHVIPKKQGVTSVKNLVLACARCNREKNTRILSKAETEALRLKNKKKKGTYRQPKERYPTENGLALKLNEFC